MNLNQLFRPAREGIVKLLIPLSINIRILTDSGQINHTQSKESINITIIALLALMHKSGFNP